MTILSQLNSLPVYAVCGGIIAFVAVICVVFMVRAWRAGVALGMDRGSMRRAITSRRPSPCCPAWVSCWA